MQIIWMDGSIQVFRVSCFLHVDESFCRWKWDEQAQVNVRGKRVDSCRLMMSKKFANLLMFPYLEICQECSDCCRLIFSWYDLICNFHVHAPTNISTVVKLQWSYSFERETYNGRVSAIFWEITNCTHKYIAKKNYFHLGTLEVIFIHLNYCNWISNILIIAADWCCHSTCLVPLVHVWQY